MTVRSAFAVLAAILSLLALPAGAQSFPAKPVRLIVPYSVGTPPDIVSRLIADRMGAGLGQPEIILDTSRIGRVRFPAACGGEGRNPPDPGS